MKSLLLFFSFLFTCYVQAQDSIVVLSRYEQQIKQAGKMYRTDAQVLGNFSGLDLSLLKVTDLDTRATFHTVKLQHSFLHNQEPVDSRVFYWDAAELDGSIRFLDTLQAQLNLLPTPEEVTLTYVTPGGVQFSFFKRNYDVDFHISRLYLQERTPFRPSTQVLARRRIAELVSLFKTARNRINEATASIK